MPYNETKAQLRKDLAAGKFQQEEKGFLSNVKDMYLDYSLRSMLAEEADERSFKKKAEEDRQAKIKNAIKEAKSKEAEARDYQRKAKNLLIDTGYTTQVDNPNFMQVALEQIYAAEGNYNAALTRMETLQKDGRLRVLDPKIGPLMPGFEADLDTAIASTDRIIENEIAEGGIENSDTAQAVYDMSGQTLGRGAFKSALEQQMDGIMGAIPPEPRSEVTGFRAELRSSESSGDPTAVDFNKDDGKDHVGLYQFGQDRLDEVNKALGTSYTVDDIKAGRVSADEQERLADWHFADIDKFITDKGLDKFIGTEINGAVVTKAGMAAVAHLGGKGGLEQFLMTDGAVDPSDGQTKLSDYMKRFENSEYTSAQMNELGLDDSEQGLMIDPVKGPALLDWSKVTKDGYKTYAKTLEQQGKIEEAKKVLEFGDATFGAKKTDTLTEAKYAALYAANSIALTSTNEKERQAAEAWFRDEEPKLSEALRKVKGMGADKDPVFITLKSGRKVQATENEDGSFTSISGTETYQSKDLDSIETAEQLGLKIDLYNDLKGQMKDQRNAMASAVSATVQGYNLVELAKKNEAVLTLVGSGVATVEGAAKELEALVNLLGGGAEGETQSAVLGKMNSYIDEIKGIDPELAADYRQFAAAMTRYVYASGKALGQTGNGFSDKDFKNLRDAMFAGKGIEEFENNIRTFSKDRLDDASRTALGLQGSRQVQLTIELGGSFGTDLLTAEDYIAAVSLEGDPDYYAWANSANTAAASQANPSPEVTQQAISNYNNGQPIKITAELKAAYPNSPVIQNAEIGDTIQKKAK